MNPNVQTMTLNEVRARGLAALKKELGVVGMIRFLQQYETGSGDYSAERGAQLDGMDVDAIMADIRRNRAE